MCNAICCLGVSAVEDPESCRQRSSCSAAFHSHTSCKGGGVHLNTALASITASCYGLFDHHPYDASEVNSVPFYNGC